MSSNGRGGKYARYGCSQHWNRGACNNDLTINRELAERTFFEELQKYAESPEAIECVLGEFEHMVRAASDRAPDEGHLLTARKQQLEQELKSLASALAQGAPVTTVKSAIKECERELRDIDRRFQALRPTSVEEDVDELRRFALARFAHVASLIRERAENAKYELSKHCGEITMVPLKTAEGQKILRRSGRLEFARVPHGRSYAVLTNAPKGSKNFA